MVADSIMRVISLGKYLSVPFRSRPQINLKNSSRIYLNYFSMHGVYKIYEDNVTKALL